MFVDCQRVEDRIGWPRGLEFAVGSEREHRRIIDLAAAPLRATITSGCYAECSVSGRRRTVLIDFAVVYAAGQDESWVMNLQDRRVQFSGLQLQIVDLPTTQGRIEIVQVGVVTLNSGRYFSTWVDLVGHG